MSMRGAPVVNQRYVEPTSEREAIERLKEIDLALILIAGQLGSREGDRDPCVVAWRKKALWSRMFKRDERARLQYWLQQRVPSSGELVVALVSSLGDRHLSEYCTDLDGQNCLVCCLIDASLDLLAPSV